MTVLEHFGHGEKQTQALCWWYGDFSVKRLDSLDDEPCWSHKPDLILLEGRDGGPITWKSLKALGKFTYSTLAANTTLIKTLNTKAYLLLSSQPWHCYVLTISFANFHMQVHFYNRSGAQVLSPLSFHCDLQHVMEVIHAFAHADRDLLGYDLTINICHIPSIPKQVNHHNFISTVIFGPNEIYNIIELLRRAAASLDVVPYATMFIRLTQVLVKRTKGN